MKPHFVNKEVKVVWNSQTESFDVLVFCAGTPRHGWNWVWYATFSTMEDAIDWARDKNNVS